MARVFQQITLDVLREIGKSQSVALGQLRQRFFKDRKVKDFHNLVFRLKSQGLVKEIDGRLELTPEGESLISTKTLRRDGEWKMIIYDIPEKEKYVRNVLRSKLKQLGFKKWQNSIWVSPYFLDSEIEKQLDQLAQKYFIRLIRVKSINYKQDLESLFS